jgi:hypothetical protein
LTVAAARLAGRLAAGNAGIGWRRRCGGALAAGKKGDADNGVAAAATEEAAALAFVEDDEFDVVPVGAEGAERPVKGVFDGFAACFGLIHVWSSILDRR